MITLPHEKDSEEKAGLLEDNATILVTEAEEDGLSATDAVVKAPADVLDFTKLTVDELVDRIVDKAILEAVLKKVALPVGIEAMFPARPLVNAMERMAEVIATLQSRLMLLETSIATERRAGRGTSRIDLIAGEDPTRKAIRRLQQREVATISATDSAFGRNWWPAEGGGEDSWRWSGPKGHSTVLVPSAGLEEGWISIEFGRFGHQSIQETFSRIRPTFYLDDQRLEFTGVEGLGDQTERAMLSAPFSRTHGALPSHSVLHIHLETLQRPSDEIPGSNDKRRLGLKVSRIIVSSTPVS